MKLVLGSIAIAISMMAVPMTASAQVAGPQPSAKDLRPNAEYFQREYDLKTMMSEPESAANAYSYAGTMAACLAKAEGDDAGAYLGGPMTDDAAYKALTKALTRTHRTCFNKDAAGIPMSVVNGALAEKLVVRSDAELDPRAMSVNMDEAEKWYMAGADKPSLDSIGRCVAVYSPGLTKAMLASTEPGSIEERAELSKLFRATPECGLVDSPSNIPAAFQRGALAIGLYQWTHRG